jgi:sugar lactone lactonase YvrE
MRSGLRDAVAIAACVLAVATIAWDVRAAEDGRGGAGPTPAQGVRGNSNVTVELVAGSGSNGDGGLADHAHFVGLAGIASDDSGNIYLSDSGANRVRRIDATTQIIATVAGTGRLDDEGSQASHQARLRAPGPVAVGPEGRSLYVGEVVGRRVKQVHLDTGSVEDLGAPPGGWGRISGLVWSRIGLVASDALLGDIFLKRPDGVWVSLLPGKFRLREGIRTIVQDSRDRFYISEYFAHRVLRLDARSGLLELFAGTGESGMGEEGANATATAMRGPDGLAFDNGGRLLIADSGNRRILRVDINTGIVSIAHRAAADSPAGLWTPGSLTVERDNNLWMADSENDRLLRFGTNGPEPQVFGATTIGDGGPAVEARLAHPSSIAIDRLGHVYISDTLHHRIRRVDRRDGTIVTVAGTGVPAYNGDAIPAVDAALSYPAQIQIDQRDRLFIADYYSNRIRVTQLPDGRIFTYAGTGQAGEEGDGGHATSATLANPHVLFLDGEDTLIVTSGVMPSIRRIDLKTGTIQAVANDGLPQTEIIHGVARFGDSLLLMVPRPLPGRIDRLSGDKRSTVLRGPDVSFPYHAVVAPGGEAYICDTGGNRILKWNGSTLSPVIENIGRPRAIALDRDGSLLVADTFHNQVLRLRFTAKTQ